MPSLAQHAPLIATGAEPLAHFAGRLATGLRDVTSDLTALDSAGFWAVMGTYEGDWTLARFDDVRDAPLPPPTTPWIGPDRDAWVSSMDQGAYVGAVKAIRDEIAAGEVYQVNLCRVLSAPIASQADPVALAARLHIGNPAPYAGLVDVPGTRVVTASPELFLRRDRRRVTSEPIKGTARTAEEFLPKDTAENIMIVDLVRNDLARVAEIGTVEVPSLLRVEPHPGLVHLVSTVTADLAPDAGWPELVAATFPAGSITGAPKSSALRIIDDLENAARGPYCGAIGWVDADRGLGELAVGIRTFWWRDGRLCFGTGAGITWGSDPLGEWDETELKAARLLAVASGPQLVGE
ncbi:chorismate-binding protein [Catenulispora pinisilvae]|uniref:chorismate-binding protein n=1 Tax=Catenulispora pinisilvae TaxID=2705253 RepID=UPI002B265BB8|nr:chorismate-binding protein [Catenulispora pinisilvae]